MNKAQMARQASIAWAQSVMTDPAHVAVFDTETTGVDASAEVIDIAVINGYGETLIDTLVKPVKPIPKAASRVHGIDDAMVSNAPFWPVVYSYMLQIFEEHPVVVIYNLSFDLRLVNQNNRIYGLADFNFHQQGEPFQWSCAMRRYSSYAGDWNKQKNDWKWHKLGEAIQSFGIEVPSDAHRALADAQSTLKLVSAMAKETL